MQRHQRSHTDHSTFSKTIEYKISTQKSPAFLSIHGGEAHRKVTRETVRFKQP